MSLDSFFFLIKTSFTNLFRNRIFTVASVLALTVCMSLIGTSFIFLQNVNAIIDSLGKQNQLVIYVDENMTSEELTEYGNALNQIDNIVTPITYKSKEQAMEEYKSSFGEEYSEITEGLDPSILRNSFIIEMKDFTKYDQTLFEIQKIEGAANIVQKKEVIDSLSNIKDILMFLFAVAILFLLVVSFLVIGSTVKSEIASRKNEIYIMKYCGASDLFVKFPFFLEGIFIGIISGILGFFALNILYYYIFYQIIMELAFITPVSFLDNFSAMLLIFIIGGAIIGGFGMIMPLHKYLNNESSDLT